MGSARAKGMTESVLKMERIHFSYGRRPVLEGVDLTLESGEFLALAGPNGSGKSTLVKLAFGSIQADSGKIFLFGKPVTRFREWSRIGYVSQKANSFNLDFPATVREVVASGLYGKLGLFRRMKRQHWIRVEEVIHQVGLSALADQRIGRLSGGQQQRAFIARALVSDPDLLILDEPTVGVDTASAREFHRLLGHLHREKGLSLLLITHDLQAVTDVVDRVIWLGRERSMAEEAGPPVPDEGDRILMAAGQDAGRAFREGGVDAKVTHPLL
ncbi:zinc transport system ATP-binding protein [Kroppenstedtia eburnea]|uniref:Zinc transport system ATP-binding protein n=2 Tax=Kroppenstedtia eburnea TaxID=714067 RepID=A0A1N7JGM8_9BACL|nr:metal ABC transporter ATP-binding protein [Kroppenstedtia eburnea]SIS48523.1 zinc transport system ATP-binding protein [Kroppenstedtia eburnea]